MNKRKMTIDFLEKRYDYILESKKNGTISWVEIKDAFHQETGLNLHKDYFRSVFKTLVGVEDIVVNNSKINSPFIYINGNENKDKGTKEFVFTADRIPTEEEVISHFNIDLQKYRISQIWHKTTPGGKYSISILLNNLKALDSKNYEEKFERFLEKYNSKILENPFKNSIPINNNPDKEDSLYLISLSDLHIGNYQKENYIKDIESSCIKLIKDADLVGAKEIILLNTGDMLHTDTSKSQTWNNTQLDSQDSFEDAFTKGLDLITVLIDYARQFDSKLTFVNVRGNHSFDTEYCMGEALKRIYKNDKKINIINQKDTRIYYKWKNNGFCFSHGDRGVERMPLLFATEGKEIFANTDHHHIILGHLHHTKGKQYINDRAEYAGIEVRVVGSPTSNDIWHKQNGFCQNKKAITTMIFTENQGKYGEFTIKI